jgi:hypothetical protein
MTETFGTPNMSFCTVCEYSSELSNLTWRSEIQLHTKLTATRNFLNESLATKVLSGRKTLLTQNIDSTWFGCILLSGQVIILDTLNNDVSMCMQITKGAQHTKKSNI